MILKLCYYDFFSFLENRIIVWQRILCTLFGFLGALSTKATGNGDSQPGPVHRSYWQWRLTAWPCPRKLLAMETRSLALSTEATGSGDAQPGFVTLMGPLTGNSKTLSTAYLI